MLRILPLVLLTLAPAILHAAPRPWKSADGTRSVTGEFVSRDETSIVIRRGDRKEITIRLDQLHPDDRSWIAANQPLPGEGAPPPSAVFDHLSFGDNRDTVLKKLQASKLVESTVEETFFARTGLNGVFKTRKQIGGLDALLYFDWTPAGGLNEVTLHTKALPAADLDDRLRPCWQEFIELLTTLHGQPANANMKLDLAPLEDGSISCTHLWKLGNRGSALLGAARQGDGYQIAVRFTTEIIQPVPVSAGSAPSLQTP